MDMKNFPGRIAALETELQQVEQDLARYQSKALRGHPVPPALTARKISILRSLRWYRARTAGSTRVSGGKTHDQLVRRRFENASL